MVLYNIPKGCAWVAYVLLESVRVYGLWVCYPIAFKVALNLNLQKMSSFKGFTRSSFSTCVSIDKHGYQRLPHVDGLVEATICALPLKLQRRRIRQARRYCIRIGRRRKLHILHLCHVPKRERGITSFLASIKRCSTMWIKMVIKVSMEEGCYAPFPLPLPILPSTFLNMHYQ